MSSELKAFSRDLLDRITWLLNEAAKLTTENERLLTENKRLREEITLARLFRDIEQTTMVEEETTKMLDLPSGVPKQAMAFYQHLPETFNFAAFFSYAEREGLTGHQARDSMLIYFRENMLRQRGTHIEKTGNIPYPKRIAR